MRRSPSLPVLLLTAYAGLVVIYSLATPLFEAPDEVWHYAYVRYIVERRALPALTGGDSGAYQEVAQPPLYYAAAALFSGLARDDDLPELMWHNPGFGYQAGGTVNDNKNMLIHTARECFPWRGAVLAIRLARLASLAWGVIAVMAAWGLAGEAFPDRPVLVLSTASVVAFTPQFLFISGVVSNDSAAAALSTAALWAMARILRHGVTLCRTLGLGLVAGLAILTKTSTLLLLPLAVVVILLGGRAQIAHCKLQIADCKLQITNRKSQIIFVHCALFIACSLLVGGWWYLRNALLYHDPLGVSVHENTPWGRAVPASAQLLLSRLPVVYRSFWGAFGWGHVEFPRQVYAGVGALIVLSLVGWGMAWKRRTLPGQGAVLILAVAWGGATFAALLQWMRQVEAPHGRLLFPAIAAFALLLVAGWASLCPPGCCPCRRRARVAQASPPARARSETGPSWTLLLPLLMIAALAPWTTIRPAFAPPRLLRPAEAGATVGGTWLMYGDAARLLGVAVEPSSTTPGGMLTVRACWEALAPLAQDYTVFVHLVGRDNLRVGERHTYPGLGRFPTSRWPVGWAFCDSYRLRVAEWAAVPELYDVVVGLYDATTGERLSVRAPDGAAVSLPILAAARVAPAQPLALPEDARRVDFRLGENIALVGYRLSALPEAGAPLTVTLYWRALSHPTEDYTVFVHLFSGTSPGELIAQHDSPPRAGRYPTSAWQPGDVIPDEHVLEVITLPDGETMHLMVGMYRPATMERLPVVGPAGPLAENALPLP